jgi:hypothetical protein
MKDPLEILVTNDDWYSMRWTLRTGTSSKQDRECNGHRSG